ncbi:MAG: AAA family ATPase, partial [Aureliella sp.]
MHEELFHSPERPFRATPDTRFYYPHESVESARQTVVRAVLRAEGPVMVLGGAGLGKSLLGMLVADDLAARFDLVQLHAARLCSRRALLQSILFELRLPYRELSEGELRLSILARLEPSSDYAPDGVLIVVDEAHTLPVKLLD